MKRIWKYVICSRSDQLPSTKLSIPQGGIVRHVGVSEDDMAMLPDMLRSFAQPTLANVRLGFVTSAQAAIGIKKYHAMRADSGHCSYDKYSQAVKETPVDEVENAILEALKTGT